ncbi:hypothetical protein GC096_25995 [Paenibacillus sp. LMG 31461]|uniref:RecF/RecN/SMC N-terminal domain-containing protein n=1 Tax=Paenibacillus plantarum TaxID=2654975 RepID=A0ABX1XG52_9BACL|nr:hypothetical protein [Paenibacillus plantarum]NOU67500.1 hypothetical protein [Paenibacillus plantarum]
MKINSITVEGFRGLLGVHKYELDGKSLLLYAQNGMGKSSLIDAIDYFRNTNVNGQLEQLKAREYGGIKTLKHLNKVGDGEVSISFTENKSGTRKVTDKGAQAPSLAKIIEQSTEYDWIFRLSDIMKVLDATPGQRYESIANAVGILPLMNISKKMDSVKRWSQDNPYGYQMKSLFQEITSLLGTSVFSKDEPLFIEKLCEKYKIEYDLKFINNFNELKSKVKEHKNDIKDQTGVKNAEIAIFNLDEVLEEIAKLNNQHKDLEETDQKLKELQIQSNAASLFKLLEASTEYLHDHQPENCPVCESIKIDWQKQKDRIRTDLINNKSYITLSKRIEEIKSEINSSEKSIGITLTKVQTNFKSILKESKESKFAATALELKTMSLLELDTAIRELKQLLGTFVSSTISTTNLESLINLERDIEEIEKHIGAYEVLALKNEIHATFASQIADTAKSFSKFCIDEMDSRFADVVERAQEIFSEIVDNPMLETGISVAHSFKVVPIKAREITLLMNYLGRENVAPTGYLNESWMRAYGLGLIFSLIERGNKTFPVLVLDDVFSSFDFPNQRRIANFLAENFKHFQLIITTHDAYFNKCMKDAIKRNNSNTWKTIEAYNYDRRLGQVSYKNSLTEIEEIDELLMTAVKATGVANPIRIFFEDWCRIHCDLLSVSLPFKGEISTSGYDLGELWPPLQKAIKPHFSGQLGSIKLLDEIEKNRSDLSFGSHGQINFNEHSPVEEYRTLWENIKRLNNLLSCPICKGKGKHGYMRIVRGGILVCHGVNGKNPKDNCNGTSYNFPLF